MRRSLFRRAVPAFPFSHVPLRHPDIAGWGLLIGSMIALAASSAFQPAAAQGLLDALFGNNAPAAQPAPAPVPVHGAHDAGPRSLPLAPLRAGENSPPPRPSGGSLRTVCVRMCDGYYFPISNAVRRSEIGRDIKLCDTRCGSESRLFMLPANSSADAAEMTDVMGRRYSQLPNAFRYRKSLVPGCACKPVPWASSERLRHQEYALNEAEAQARGERLTKLAETGEAGSEPAARKTTIAESVVAETPPALGAPMRAAPSLEGPIPAATSGDLLGTVHLATPAREASNPVDDDAVAAVVRAAQRRATPAKASRTTRATARQTAPRTAPRPAPRAAPTAVASSAPRWPGD